MWNELVQSEFGSSGGASQLCPSGLIQLPTVDKLFDIYSCFSTVRLVTNLTVSHRSRNAGIMQHRHERIFHFSLQVIQV